MCFLGPLVFGGVNTRFFGHILATVKFTDLGAGGRYSLARKRGGVSTHIGDVTGLVQALSYTHSVARVQAQFTRGLLLQGGGGEWRGRTARVGAGFHLAHLGLGLLNSLRYSLRVSLMQVHHLGGLGLGG